MTQQHKTCIAENRAVTIRQIGILHIVCKMFTIHCYTAIHMWSLLNQAGRARICSASLKTTRRVNCLRFSYRKSLSTFTFQGSSSGSHKICAIQIHCNILPYTNIIIDLSVESKYIVLRYCYIILIYCDSSSWKRGTAVASTTCNRKGIHVLWYSTLRCSWTSSMRMW